MRGAPRTRKRPLGRARSTREWSAARAKVEREGRCRVCGIDGRLDAAHLIARARVRPGEGEGPENIVPLCRRCHRAFDERRLDLLPHLTVAEQTKAVELAGGIVSALRRLTDKRE